MCPIQNESILSIIVVYYCNLWYPVISVRKWNVCYFFLIFCYKMKCLGILRIYLPLFFSYVYYSCHTSWLKYTGTIWTTLYGLWRMATIKLVLPTHFNNIYALSKHQSALTRFYCPGPDPLCQTDDPLDFFISSRKWGQFLWNITA